MTNRIGYGKIRSKTSRKEVNESYDEGEKSMKYRLTFGRLLFEIMFGRSSDIVRSDNKAIAINISKVARRIRVRPIRLKDVIGWAANYDMIEVIGESQTHMVIRLRSELCEMPCIGSEIANKQSKSLNRSRWLKK